RLSAELKVAKETISRQNIELEELRAVVNKLESTASTHQAQRDQAVADRVAYETLFAAINAQLRIFKIPETLAKVIDNERLPEPRMPQNPLRQLADKSDRQFRVD